MKRVQVKGFNVNFTRHSTCCRRVYRKLLRGALVGFVLLTNVFSIIHAAAKTSAPDVIIPRADWKQVSTPHLRLIGDVSESELREIALRLEHFHNLLSPLLVSKNAASSPVVVIVFQSENEFAPYKPLHGERTMPGIAGYFKGATGNNYIAFAKRANTRDTIEVAFHEYVHLLTNNRLRAAPLWLKEGIADYYSTAEIGTDKRHLTLGKAKPECLQTLHTGAWIPLNELFNADTASTYYLNPEKRRVFYAESWSLTHFLLHGNTGAHRLRFARLLDSLADGIAFADAFRQAFGIEAEKLERELHKYVRQNFYPSQVQTLESASQTENRIVISVLRAEEVYAALGDLLLCLDRLDEAEEHLLRSLKLDPNLAAGQISFGTLEMRRNNLAAAREYLARAVKLDERNPLAHFAYADALSRETPDATLQGYAAQTDLIRRELLRAVELAPAFLEAYKLLAENELGRGRQLREVGDLLDRVLASSPEPTHVRQELHLLRACIYLQLENFDAARTRLSELHPKSSDDLMRKRVEKLLAEVTKREALRAARQADDPQLPEHAWRPSTLPCDLPQPGLYSKPTRFEGEQRCGHLTQINCTDDGVVLIIDSDNRALRLHAAALNKIKFVTYTTAAGRRITCGATQTPLAVLVTYRPLPADTTGLDGTALAVEFVPPEWNLEQGAKAADGM